MELPETVLAGAVLVTFALVVAVASHLFTESGSFRTTLADRLLYGIPWGAAISLALVLAFYLFGQGGLTDFRNPVEIPFRAWSYYYPFGILTSSFSHASGSHITSNLAAAALVAPIAEYAWGHYPLGSPDGEPAWWQRPWIRACCIVPGVTIGIGILTGIFSLGPVIGFSSVVFAFAGFALVRYPVTTLVASVAGQGAILTIYRALETPILIYTPSASGPSTPGWATIAIQGHAIGFAIGLLLGLYVFRRRGERPDPFRFWISLVLFGFAKSLWAVYWFGDGSYVLLRAPGVVLVLLLSLVLALAVARPVDRQPMVDTSLPAAISRGADRAVTAVRANGLVVLLVLVAILAGPAIPANVFVVEDQDLDETESLSVADYEVTYAEDVENEMISAVNVSALGIDTSVQASGVIVASDQRNVWIEVVSANRLAHSGEADVELGGLGWRETVTADRTGWRPVGNETAYQVWLEGPEERVFAHASDPVRADLTIDGATLAVDPTDESFTVVLERSETTETTTVPPDGESTQLGALTIEHEDGTLYAVHEETRVQVATEST